MLQLWVLMETFPRCVHITRTQHWAAALGTDGPNPLSGDLLKVGERLPCLGLFQRLLLPPFHFFYSKVFLDFLPKSVCYGKRIIIKLPWWDTTYYRLCQRGQLSVVNLLQLGKNCYSGRTRFLNALHWLILFSSSKSFLKVGWIYTKIQCKQKQTNKNIIPLQPIPTLFSTGEKVFKIRF